MSFSHGTPAFFRLWLAQVVSATGDWLGLMAITALAAAVSRRAEGVAVGLVLGARVAPGFFLAPLGRRARRSLGPQEGDDRLRPRAGPR